MAGIYDIAFDWQRDILLSCGLEGKVKSLDLATGKSKILNVLRVGDRRFNGWFSRGG
ncbi:MAG: hypothetical protein HWQ41_29345 [Nostoc sp. NOS(2021)]|uniref:hypothetical protein n=1 Tax=Nostoc sp. NOS(2021) TaxID=2815407 RepID=UPI0025D2EAD1|nr:hypothetical protein [Nostoc sp. NOS(2021)]MBN3899229.1 hypothetical protein [Nostoc sp. NOS(2021)]